MFPRSRWELGLNFASSVEVSDLPNHQSTSPRTCILFLPMTALSTFPFSGYKTESRSLKTRFHLSASNELYRSAYFIILTNEVNQRLILALNVLKKKKKREWESYSIGDNVIRSADYLRYWEYGNISKTTRKMIK